MSPDHSTTVNNQLNFAVFIVILMTLPLPEGANRPMYWGISEILVFLLTGLQLLRYPSWLTLRNAIPDPMVPLLLVMALICTWLAIQAVAISIDTHATQDQLIKSLSYLCLMFLAAVLITGRSQLQVLLWALLISGAFQATYGSIVALAEGKPASGSFVNRNHLAGYLEMVLALGTGMLLAEMSGGGRGRGWRATLRGWLDAILSQKAAVRVLLAIMVTGLILTQSRMGNTAFFSSLLLMAIASIAIFRGSSRGLIIFFVSLLVIDTFLMGTFFGLDRLRERMERVEDQAGDRMAINRNFVGQATERVTAATETDPAANEAVEVENAPLTTDSFSFGGRALTLLTGTGAGTFYTAFPAVQPRELTSRYLHAHNDYIEFAMEFGAIGMALLVTLLGLSLRAGYLLIRGGQSRFRPAIALACMMATISLLIHSFVDFNLQIHANAATYLVILSLPAILLGIDPPPPRPTGSAMPVRDRAPLP